MSKKYKVGFTLISYEYEKWHAGLTCVLSHINLTKHLKDFQYIIFTDSKNFVKKNIIEKDILIIETSIFKKKNFLNFIRKLIIFLFKKDLIFFYLLKRYNINILSHRDLFKNKKVKSIAWIPDAQHLVLKDTFNHKEFKFRLKLTEKQMRNSDMVFVESHSVKKYYKKYYKKYDFFPLRRAVKWFTKSSKCKFIYIKKPFFYYPSQLWLHKNHLFLVDLAKKLKEKNIKCKFVFSGKTFDHRNPDHFQNLVAKINSNGLDDYFQILGHVRSEQVVKLIKSCSALISPSRHEGWATISEESRFFGKYVFLSKNACHLEQKPPGAIYFNLNNVKDLEKKIIRFIKYPPKYENLVKLKRQCLYSYANLKNETINQTIIAYNRLLNKNNEF